MKFQSSLVTLLLMICCSSRFTSIAQTIDETEESNAKYQITLNRQYHPGFNSSTPSGPNTLTNGPDSMYTTSATAHWGYRAWDSGEIYFDPEMVTGVPFTGNLVGLGGFTNGEITRAAGVKPSFYRQRLFLRQTWGDGGDKEKLESDFNQLAGYADKNRKVLTIGNFSILDVFDGNSFAKDPRRQFQNWGNWTYAAYDYAADSRGYGWGFTVEWYKNDWVYRIGRMTTPLTPNSQALDFNLSQHFGDQLEIEHSYKLFNADGSVRLLLYHDRSDMSSFNDATAYLQSHNYPIQTGPDALIAVRQSNKDKYGIGINIEQEIGSSLGVFLRAMKSDGKTETLAFTEVDSSLSTGLLFKGDRWGRADDSFGTALMIDWISADRLRFLQAGGVSFFIGDGIRNFLSAPEQILENFYSFSLSKNQWLTADWQWIRNPAYNAQRGPVNILGARYHLEF